MGVFNAAGLDSLSGGYAAGSYASGGSFDSWSDEGDSGGGFDWGTNITRWLQLTPNIIAASKGNPYGSSPYGQQGAPVGSVPGGQGGVYAGGSLLGASGFGQISGTTLLLIGVGLIFLLKRR